jgi:tripartite-type tricarboxylate transporter receptor subunit TctC
MPNMIPDTLRLRCCMAALLGLTAACAASSALSADYPAKPVRLIVPFAPGGSSDSVARMIGSKLAEVWGQQVVVDNRPGGRTTIGAGLVARAPADGYTLLLANANHTVNPALMKSLPYDPLKDFAPVVRLADQAVALLIHPSLPAHTVKEFIKLAKSRPGQLNFASPGVGTASHMTGLLFQALTKIDMVFVPYKGAGPSLVDLMAGQVTVGASGLTSSLPFIDAGKLRALGVTTAKRSGFRPEIPTIAEAGVPGFEVTNWFGILAPGGTPAPVVDGTHQQVVRIVSEEPNRQLMLKMGLEPALMGPAQFGAFMQSEIDKWIRVGREMGLQRE